MYKYIDSKSKERDMRPGTYRYNDEGELVTMANFTAQIVENVTYVDGQEKKTVLTLTGECEGEELPPVEVDATAFAGLTWIIDYWGSRPLILPGNANKDNLRAAIQMRNKPTNRIVYLATGWQEIDGVWHYLHAAGAIGPKGHDPSISVKLPEDLARYNLTTDVSPVEGMRASLQLRNIANSRTDGEESESPEFGWVLLACTYAPLFGPCDFGAHVTARSGSFKSESVSLGLAHYGPMDPHNGPGSWSSTGNANEALAYRTRNALFMIDDFVPTGTSQDKTKLNKAADQIFRGQGNQAGKARLTDRSNMQQTMYPRGLVFSTGEDTPDGQSLRARIAITELQPGDITSKELSRRQADRKKYIAATAGLCQWLAKHPKRRQQVQDAAPKLRDSYTAAINGHSRTAPMVGHLIAVIRMVLAYAKEIGAIPAIDYEPMKKQAEDAIVAMGIKQKQYLEQTDPSVVILESIRKGLTSGAAHFRTLSGGTPSMMQLLGWTETGESGAMPTYRANGRKWGWVDWDTNSMFLDINSVYADIKRLSDNRLQLTQQTAIKRMREGGLLNRIEGNRNRNTVRITAEQHPRTVVSLDLRNVLGTNEVPT